MRVIGIAIVIAWCALMTGCDLPSSSSPQLVDGPRLETELESQLLIPLKEVAPPPFAAGFANVDAVYTGETPEERLVVIVFDSEAATVQVLGDKKLSPETITRKGDTVVIRHRNTVVLYQHEPAVEGRESQIRSALERATA